MKNLNLNPWTLAPDGDGGGAGGTVVTNPPVPPVTKIGGVEVDTSLQPKLVDMDAKVMVDGKQVLVRDLVTSHKKASELDSQLARTKTAMSRIYGKAGEGVTLETEEQWKSAQEDFTLVRQAAGYSDDEIRAEWEAFRKDRKGEAPPEGDKALDEKLEKHPTLLQAQAITNSNIKRVVNTALEATLNSDPQLKLILDSVKVEGAADGGEDYKGLRATFAEELRRELTPLIKKRMQAAGGILQDLDWIEEDLKPAAAKVVMRHKPYLRVIEQVGKQSLPDFAQGLPDKPLAMPKVDHGDNEGFQKNLDDFINDRVSRMIADSHGQRRAG